MIESITITVEADDGTRHAATLTDEEWDTLLDAAAKTPGQPPEAAYVAGWCVGTLVTDAQAQIWRR